MTPTFLTSLLLALGVTSALAGHHTPHHRAVGGHMQRARAPAPRPARHDYILNNATLAAKVNANARRGIQGQATFYHPQTEGESAVGSCGGHAMDDNTMGVALASPGYKYFADHGLDAKDLCFKTITIKGLFGDQKARIMDECPESHGTKTCLNACDIDLTYGLFGMLAQHTLGIFNVEWSFDDGTPSPCGPTISGAKSSAKSAATSVASKAKSAVASATHEVENKVAGAKASVSASASGKASASASSSSSSSASDKDVFKTTLEWWDVIDPQWCPGIKTPKGTTTVAVGPSKTYPNEKLGDSCGKWITIETGGKKHNAQVVEWIPDTTENFLAVGNEYNSIIGGSASASVKWSFDA